MSGVGFGFGASNGASAGASPTGAAGGSLGGTYPNPTVVGPLDPPGATVLALIPTNGSAISIGSGTVATTGTIRLANGASIVARSGTNNENLLSLTADLLHMGDAINTAVVIESFSTEYLRINGVDIMVVSSSNVTVSKPIVGDGVNSPYSIHGTFTQAMADAPRTISAANSANHIIIATGALTAARLLTLTCAPTAGGWKFINNQCSGFSLQVGFSSGSAVTIAVGKNAIVYGDGVNAQVITVGQ